VLTAAGLVPLWGCGQRREPGSKGGLRVASQTVLADEVLWDLGASVRATVVAVSPMADDVRYSRVAQQWPAEVPRAAGTSEALLAVAPSLVVIASFTAAETRRLLEHAGVRTLVLERFDGFDDHRANVRAIAGAVGAKAEGERLVAELDAKLRALRFEPAVRPRVVSWNEGNVPAAGTTFDDVAEAAGFRNLPAERGRTGHLQVSVEQLVAWDPDAIVVPCDATRCEQAAAELAERPGLRATRAAREGHVIGVPSRDLYSTGAGMLDAVEHLRAAHPGARR